MNIKEIAKEAGLKRHQEQAPGIDGAVGSWEELERFAKLVAAHEREECAELCQRFSNRMMSAGECADAIRARGKA